MTIPADIPMDLPDNPAVADSRPISLRAVADVETDAPNSVLGKVALILQAFTIDDDELTLSHLSRRSGVPKASVHRLAQELLELGFLERAGASYRLGLRLFEIGARVPRTRALRESLLPFMHALHSATKQTILLTVLQGSEIVFVERVNSYGQAPSRSKLGGHVPLHCSATGKVFMAFGPPELFDTAVRAGLTRLTPNSAASPVRLRAQIDRVRADGHAVEYEEVMQGFSSIAVPLYESSGALIAGLSVTGTLQRSDIPRFTRSLMLAKEMIETSRAIT
jgi:DNA-binding IclR family transcriptional regulator